MNDQPQKEPQTEAERILERKKFVAKTLMDKFSTDIWRDRLLKIAKGDESRIMKSLNSFITYIMNDKGGKDDGDEETRSRKKKVYIADCAISTISSSFLEAFQMGIEVGGGRDHAYLVNYAGICELEISYKGFAYALGQHFDNPFVVAENVFQGDKLIVNMKGENATYEYTPNPEDPFPSSWEKLVGCFCYFSYNQRASGEKVSRLVRIQKTGPDGLDMIRSKARGSFAWKDFPFEQTKKSTLRRGAKIPFAMIDFEEDDVNPEEQDNKHYQLEKSSSDRLQSLMDAYREDEDEGGKKALVPMGKTEHPDAGKNANEKTTIPQDDGDKAPEVATSEDNNRPKGTLEKNSGAIDASYEEIAEQSQGNASPSAEETPEAPKGGWDRKTIHTGGGKSIQKENFTSASSAAVYLKKIISQRTKKEMRREILDANALLLAELQADGNEKLLNDLNNLVDKGE